MTKIIRKNKITMKNKLLAILILLLTTSTMLVAQDVRMTLSAPSEVSVGQRFSVTYEVNASAKNFKAPTFTEFNFWGGPMRSSGSETRIINGKVSSSVHESYTFYLSAF